MIRNKLLLAAVLISLLAACGSEPVAEQKEQVIQAVKLVPVQDQPDQNQRVFPAEVSAVKTVDVSFEVTGRLSETNLLTGSKVQKGDTLAQIDPAPFNRRVKEAQARLNQAKRELDRSESTFKKGLSSQSQLDNARTSFELAEIALNNAKQDLSYTTLKAPFDAQVSERLVENDSYVKAGGIIARLQDISRFYFNINVPERMVSGYKQGSLFKAEAEIISTPDKTFDLEYIEHSTTPDPITQTYKVVFAANANEHDQLVPGSRARVTVTFHGDEQAPGLLVPFSALVGNESEGFRIWRYQQDSSTVSATPLTVLALKGPYAIVEGDLSIGDLVVAAGANKMRENLKVKAYLPE